jgi:hypothetical protein
MVTLPFVCLESLELSRQLINLLEANKKNPALLEKLTFRVKLNKVWEELHQSLHCLETEGKDPLCLEMVKRIREVFSLPLDAKKFNDLAQFLQNCQPNENSQIN